MEVEEVVPDETAATVDEPAGNKKRKLHKYFRTHAHRNPFSDGNYDVYATQMLNLTFSYYQSNLSRPNELAATLSSLFPCEYTL
jgi:hypothetical protein